MNAVNSKLKTTYLKEYCPPDFAIETVDLKFELEEEKTQVTSVLKIRRQNNMAQALVLMGESLKLLSIELNEKKLLPSQFELSDTTLTIKEVSDVFTLKIVTEIYPHRNTALSGLYRSENLFCTQCEAEGFRKITYYLDRPDVMAMFTTTLIADKHRYPVLLANGNKIEEGDLDTQRHWVKWYDPFKKPCYLFALVAGDLACVSDTYQTQSQRKVLLEIYVEKGQENKCQHALYALKQAMAWDEQTYGREYDLDIYMIVAVNDFNMGAMENKGLNIFNSKYVLVDEKTATDKDFQNVEAVIGHEYFHNWTGNRITCRDWFQLSLKEGLTVFREQQFSAAMGSRAVKRIEDVRLIKTRQFAEDSGPMAHPVQPASYIEINNFYTMTIYHKGAEVIRMLHTLLGKEKFRKGMDYYFDCYDGQAVTIEHFVNAFATANHCDLTQFMRWYHQAGTPLVSVKSEYDESTKQFSLTFAQHCPLTPDKEPKAPFVIPIKLALYNEKGEALPITTHSDLLHTEEGAYFVLKEESNKVVFKDLPAPPIPSLLGDFSAPVKLDYAYSFKDLTILMSHDQDLFKRWESAQQLNLKVIHSLMEAYANHKPLVVPPDFIEAYSILLSQLPEDPHLLSQLLILPSFEYVAQTLSRVNVEALNHARHTLLNTLSFSLKAQFEKIYQFTLEKDEGDLSASSIGYRALKNISLFYLTRANNKEGAQLAKTQYESAVNMTEMMGALNAVNHLENEIREELLKDFYERWKKELLVVNKWLSLEAASERKGTLARIEALLSHPAFDLNNPNKVYALLGAFSANPVIFHASHGKGYQLLAEQVIILNHRNPQVAARMLEPLTQWQRLEEPHRADMKEVLLKIQAVENLSEDVYEMVTKSLAG